MLFASRFARRVRADRAGSVASEFGLISPLLAMLLFSTVEMGSVFYCYSSMQMAANVAARRMAVNTIAPAAANALVASYVPGWAAPAVTVTVTQSNAADSNANNIVVSMTASSDRLTPISLLTRLVPWTMTASATVKQEIPYVD